MSQKQSQKSYGQVMNEWQEQRSFLKRFRSRWLHPPYEALWYEKLWGYFWRLCLLAIPTIGLGFFFLKFRMRTASYRADLAEQVAKRFHATNVKCGTIKESFTGSDCLITALGADGAPGCAFNRMDAHGISFSLGSKIMRTDWTIERLSFSDLHLKLRSGGASDILSAPTPEIKEVNPLDRVFIPEFKTSSFSKQPILMQAGYGLTPRHDELKILSYTSRNFSASWGYSTTTLGGINESQMVAQETSKDSWSFVSSAGKFNQNWLTDLNIDKLDVKLTPDKFSLNEGRFTPGKHGQLTMRGSMDLKDTYVLDVALIGKQVNMNDFIPEKFKRYFSGYADFEGVVSGTVSLSSGVTSQISVKLVPPPTNENEPKKKSNKTEQIVNVGSFANNIPLLRSLYVATGESRLMHVMLSKGSFDIETGGGKCSISNINLEGGDYFRLKGSIEISEEDQDLGARAGAGQKYHFGTKILIGLNSKTAKNLPPNIIEQHFKRESDGFTWMECVLSNEDGMDITRALGEEISRMHRESLTR